MKQVLRGSILTAALAGMLAMTAAPAVAQQDEQAGVSAAVRGEVLLARADAVGRQVESGEAILLGDAIESGPQGVLQVLLLDESVLSLGPDSRIEIDKFIYDPASQGGSMTMRMTSGAMRFVAGKIASGDPADMEIVTTVGTIGIRGTIGQVSILTQEQAQQQFPEETQQANPSPNAPIVFASLMGPGPNVQGGGQGSFTFSTPNGSVDLNRPGGSVLATPGQPPVFFIAPPGSINNLTQQGSGAGNDEDDDGGDDGANDGQAGGEGDGQANGGQGAGVNGGEVQQAGGSAGPTPVASVLNQFEQTTSTGNQTSGVVDASTSGSATSTGVTLQELVAVNSGTASGSATFSGEISGNLSYLFNFANRTFDLQASSLNGGGLDDASINVSGSSAPLPSDSRTVLTVGNNGEDFAATGSGCDNCSLSARFPSTGSFSATVTHQGASGTTGERPLGSGGV